MTGVIGLKKSDSGPKDSFEMLLLTHVVYTPGFTYASIFLIACSINSGLSSSVFIALLGHDMTHRPHPRQRSWGI